jgi:UDP-2-acetamido-2-deoxy-ribo-hexuluronate aminotransferase
MDNSDIVSPIQMFDPTRDFKKHESEYRLAMDQVLLKGNFIGGEQVMELEKQLSVYTGCENVITCANGTDAIFIALLGLGIGPGDEVITVAHTWISTAETIAMTGAIPVWVDIDPETFCIDPKLIEAKITSKTKAILPVSLYGLMPDYQAIKEIADKYNIPVIEDGAQSFGAERNSYKSCSCKYTDIATTSFFPTKPLGCYGDGGAIFVKDKELAKKIRAIKSHGGLERFKHKYIGMNSRLDTLQASVLLVKMKYLDEVLDARRKCAEYYTSKLIEFNLKDIILPVVSDNCIHVWAQYSILAKDKEQRDKIVDELKKSGVNVAIFYPVPLSEQECFKDRDKSNLDFTTSVCDRVFNLPCYGEITLKEQDYIIDKIKKYYKKI